MTFRTFNPPPPTSEVVTYEDARTGEPIELVWESEIDTEALERIERRCRISLTDEVES